LQLQKAALNIHMNAIMARQRRFRPVTLPAISHGTVLRVMLLAACLLCAALAETVQLNEANVEGTILPEELQFPPSVGTELYDYDQAAGAQQQQEQQQLYVVSLDGSQASSSSTDSITQGSAAAAPLSTAPDSLPDSSDAAAAPDMDPAWQLGSFPPPPPPPPAEAPAAIQGSPATPAAAAAVPQAAANPAANAALASAVPNMGVPPAGSKVPGRYIVFFRSNVTNTQQGIER
jgi:hypothetical protein